MSDINVSIIIPHYNTPKLLKQMLDTIPMREDNQVIVIDDRSDKDIEIYNQIVASPEYAAVKFLTNDSENKGPGTARNIGMTMAKGKWIIFADADDYFLDGFYDAIERYFDSDSDIIYFPVTSKKDDETGSRHVEFANYVYNYLKANDKKSELDLRYRFTPPWSRMIRRSIIRDNFFDEIKNSEDVMFSIKTAYNAERITASDKIIYCIRENTGSNTQQGDDYSTIERTEVLINRYKFLKEHLSKRDFAKLDLAALGRIIITFRNPGSSKETRLKVIKMVLKAHMRIIPRRLFTVKFWKDRFAK